MIIKAGLIAFGLLVLMVLVFTLIFRQAGGSEPQNPYRRKVDEKPSPKEYETFEVREVKSDDEEPKEQEPSPPPQVNNTGTKRDIGEKPKDFKL